MTSSNGKIFSATGPFWGEFTGEFLSQRPVTRSLGAFFGLRLNKRLSKLSRRRWFKMPSRSLCRHCYEYQSSPLTHPWWYTPTINWLMKCLFWLSCEVLDVSGVSIEARPSAGTVLTDWIALRYQSVELALEMRHRSWSSTVNVL